MAWAHHIQILPQTTETNSSDPLHWEKYLGWLQFVCFIVSQKGHTKNGWYKNHQKSRLFSFVSTFQDIKPSFSCAKIHFRSNFIPPAFFRNAVVFPFRKLSPAVTSNSQLYNKSRGPAWRQPTSRQDRMDLPSQRGGSFLSFFHQKRYVSSKKPSVFGRYIQLSFLGGIFWGGNPQKGEKKECFLSGLSSP